MHWLIGLDEAGYGPNLGPLAIGATAWQLDARPENEASGEPNLYDRLATAIVDCKTKDGRLPIADSKKIYKPWGGLTTLERSVLASLYLDTKELSKLTWKRLLTRLKADPKKRCAELPWHKAFNPRLPIDATVEQIQQANLLLKETSETAGVGPPTLLARLVFPAEFNELVKQYGNKGAALSETTLLLLRQIIDQHQLADGSHGETFQATLDKHGGRNRYGAMLQNHFPEHLVTPLIESRRESRYRWGPHEFCFRSKGENQAEVALASMIAKLLREIAMGALNQFWQSHVQDLKPTAGYPVDAKRFRAEIQAKQQKLAIDDRLLWRSR